MFTSTSKWGYPHKVAQIVSQYEEGIITIREALTKLNNMFGSSIIKVYYTYDPDGNKINHTCVEFGLPVTVIYEF